MDLSFEGGESSYEATLRVMNVIEDVLKSESESTIIVTHGNLMSLLLKSFTNNFGFHEWRNLSNPDVFLLHFKDDDVNIDRLWMMK